MPFYLASPSLLGSKTDRLLRRLYGSTLFSNEIANITVIQTQVLLISKLSNCRLHTASVRVKEIDQFCDIIYEVILPAAKS